MDSTFAPGNPDEAKNQQKASIGRMNKEDTISLIEEQIQKAPSVAQAPDVETLYQVWDKTNLRLLRLIFDEPTVSMYRDFTDRRAVFYTGQGDRWAHLRRHIGKKATMLRSILNEHARFAKVDATLAGMKTSGSQKLVHATTTSTKVFVVHGRDDGVKETVARFLETLGMHPVVLHEKPNGGRTIIEKFEEESDVAYAVALFTPDDIGALANEASNMSPRARQNVVLEFGFFLGRLTRRRACALVKGNVELPSDYDGVLFIPFDDQGGWRFQLAKEMKAAGMNVDLNRVTFR